MIATVVAEIKDARSCGCNKCAPYPDCHVCKKPIKYPDLIQIMFIGETRYAWHRVCCEYCHLLQDNILGKECVGTRIRCEYETSKETKTD